MKRSFKTFLLALFSSIILILLSSHLLAPISAAPATKKLALTVTPSATPSTSTSTSTSIPPSTSTIARIRERNNTLLAGVKYDFKPFGFLDDDNHVVGFDVDLVQAMADEWGVKVEFVQVTSSNRIPKLVAGEVDLLAASMSHNLERDEVIDFSQTYFLDGQSLLVHNESEITGIKSLHGKTVAAIAGSTSIKQIQDHAKANSVSIGLLPFQEYPPALAALNAGKIDALTTDSIALHQFAKDNPQLRVVGNPFTKEPYGIGLPAGDSDFHALVNFTLQTLHKNGTYDAIYAKWFTANAIPYQIEQLPGEWLYTFEDSPTTFDKPAESVFDQILNQEHLIAGVKFDSAPFGFLDENNQPIGFDIDLVREFAKRWLADENAVEFVQVTSSNRIDKLAAKQVHLLAASMTHSKERDDKIDFSQTYFLDGQKLLVRDGSDIQRVADLDGKTVAAIQGSTSIDNIQRKADELGIVIEILPFLEYPQAVQAVRRGQVDALTTDSGILLYVAQQNSNLVVVGDSFTNEPYGIGLPAYDDQFRDLVNFTLQEMKKDGTYDAIYRKWFGQWPPYQIELWPGEPANEQLKEMITSDSLIQVPSTSDNAQPTSSQHYIVMEGDSLTRLAQRFYRNASRYRMIYEANRERIGDNPNLIRMGMTLIIPELEQ